MQGLPLRILSAAVLAPPVLLALYAGPPFSDGLVVVAAAAMVWEACRIVLGGGAKAGLTVLAVAGAACAITFGGLREYAFAAGVLAALAVGMMAWIPTRRGLVLAAAVLYLGAACLAFVWLRQRAPGGLELIVWLVASVWATDIGAYFAGRRIGGPRLAPRISPKKTWAGLLGGAASAAIVGVACVVWLPGLGDVLPLPGVVAFALAGAVLAAVAQSGDLLESAFKRYFHVKDASRLIPGHGGVMDRADGLLAASLAVACAMMLTKGA